jgi:hypothetical protein
LHGSQQFGASVRKRHGCSEWFPRAPRASGFQGSKEKLREPKGVR